MNTARVVVVDEDRDEALLLLSALGKAKIGAVYFQGTEMDQLPDEPLRGIRLVFLDLKLLPVPEPENYLPHTVNVLRQTVSFGSNTTGIICWTKQPDDVKMLKAELRNQQLVPAFLTAIENKLQICEEQNIQEVVRQVEQATNQMNGWRLLQQWEEVAHDAATGTSDSLLALSEDDPELLRILGAVCKGAAEANVSEQTAMEALHVGLNAILSDETEELTGDLNNRILSESLVTAVRQLRRNPLSLQQRALLNKVLLTTRPNGAQPGAVFAQSHWQGDEPFPFAMDDNQIRGFLKEVFPDRQNDDVFIRPVAESAVPCIVEVTPACDFAQGKCDHARYLGGVLIECPGDEERQRSRTLPASSRIYAKELPFKQSRSEQLDGSFKLIVNARKLGVIGFDKLEMQESVFRLRPSVMADVRTWLGSHVARPGIISV